MSKRLYIIFLLIVFLGSSIASAQIVHLTGQVVDANDRPLPNAVVTNDDKSQVQVCDDKGSFKMSLKAGEEYTLSVYLMGFREAKKQVCLSGDHHIVIQLEEDYKLLGEVVVLGPDHDRQLQKSIYSAHNINVKQVATSTNNLNQLLTRAGGVHIREEGGVGSDFDLSLSGLGGNAIRYFIDGVPLSSLGSGTNIANIPINIVDRVEIYKGVVPPELGLDALGGAVNIITKKGNNNFLDLSVNGGSFRSYGGELHGQLRHSNSGATVKGNFNYTDSRNNYLMKGVEVWDPEKKRYETGNYERFHDGYQSMTGEIQLGFTQTNWADEALLGLYYTKSRSEIQTGFIQTLVIGAAERQRDALRVSLNYSKKNIFTEGLSAQLFASHTADHVLFVDTTFRSYRWDGSYAIVSQSEIMRRGKMLRYTDRPTNVVRSNLSYQINQNSAVNFSYTLTANHNRRTDEYDPTFVPTDDSMARHTLGMSYSDNFWNDRLNITLFAKDYIFHAKIEQQDMYWITGAKDIKPEITRNHIGYGLGARLIIFPEFSTKISYERAVRMPTTREFLGNGASIYPNLKLKPEQAHNINIALFGNLNIGGQHRLNYEGTFFVRDVTNYIRRTVTNEVQSTYENVGAALVIGGEIGLKYQYKQLIDIALNSTYTDERNKSKELPDGRMDITYNNRIPNKPFFFTNSNLGINFRNPFGINHSHIRLDASYSYTHWFYLSWAAFGTKASKAVIPTQSSADIGATWSFDNNRYTIALRCNNLFDQTNYDNYMLQKPGRSLFCKISTYID